jgi:2-dehydro-3-deoxygalactonokinase
LGVLTVPEGGFPGAVAQIRKRLGDHPLLLAGMIGSNRGWKEAPYVPCPAGIDDLAAKLVWAGEREAIVPGVSYLGQGRADVMRGEEVQLLGAVAAGLVAHDALACHPGTHNKWALLRNGVIHLFGTVMTGELFSLLKDHSILADLLQGPVEVNDAFMHGVRRVFERDMLPADLFGARAEVLLGQMNKADAPSYVSGLLVGTDVRIGLMWPLTARIPVLGRKDLTRLYAAAIEQAGREAIELDGEQCFLAGIHEIAKRIP